MFSFIASIVSLVWIQEHLATALAILAALILLIILLIARRRKRRRAYLSLPILFVGNRATRTFHAAGCPQLTRISPINLVPIRTKNDLIRGGFSSCRTCNPVWPSDFAN